MEVILQEDFLALGYVGDVIKVKDGYARNFLIPRGIALVNGGVNANLLRHKVAMIQAKKAKLKAEAAEKSKALEGLRLEFTLRMGAGGRAFGSIGAKDLEAALSEKGFVFDRRQIRLQEPLKKAGEFTFQLKLHSEVTISIPVTVRSDMPAKSAKKTKGSGKKGKGIEAAAETQEHGDNADSASADSSSVEDSQSKVESEGATESESN